MTAAPHSEGMNDFPIHPLPYQEPLTHPPLPGETTAWRAQGEVISPTTHVHTEREARINRLEAARSELERLTR